MKNNGEYVCLAVKPARDPSAYKKLKERVVSVLKETYGDPLPVPVYYRIKKELNICYKYYYSSVYLCHKRILDEIKKRDLPFLLASANGASLISYALGITKINPLSPHFRCGSCRHVEFALSSKDNTALLPPDKLCPVCGKKIRADGFDLYLESFLGCHHDKPPVLSLGVPESKADETVRFIKEAFSAKTIELRKIEKCAEDRLDSFLVFVVPIDSFKADKPLISPPGYNDPAVFEYLSSPSAYECFLPYDDNTEHIKELLGIIKITNLSDLCRVCGLTGSAKQLTRVLPLIRSGYLDYRNITMCRDDVYSFLTSRGVGADVAYTVTQRVWKNNLRMFLENRDDIRAVLSDHRISDNEITELQETGFLLTRAQCAEHALTTYSIAYQKHYGAL